MFSGTHTGFRPKFMPVSKWEAAKCGLSSYSTGLRTGRRVESITETTPKETSIGWG